jgi:hypothetical protein
LWPDWLRKIDRLLEDEAVIEVVAQALEARWPQSRRRGRPGTPADVVIRMLILKHLFDWSHDDMEREVRAKRPADVTLWTTALDRHQTIFGRAPDLAAGDRGFSSATNEAAATARGVRRVVLPRRGPKSPTRRAYERQRWFRRGQRWRVGCEGRISVLKRRHGLDRCRYHGDDGMHRWVGFGVIADNLNIATFTKARTAA